MSTKNPVCPSCRGKLLPDLCCYDCGELYNDTARKKITICDENHQICEQCIRFAVLRHPKDTKCRQAANRTGAAYHYVSNHIRQYYIEEELEKLTEEAYELDEDIKASHASRTNHLLDTRNMLARSMNKLRSARGDK